MRLRNFLKMHSGGCAMGCVSIHQLPYVHERHSYQKTYFEEDSQEDVMDSDMFGEIANKKVDHFNVIGGGMYKVELCIYLSEERSGWHGREV